MVTEIYPNIFLNEIPLPKNPLKSINSYIIRSERRNLIIDTGFNTEECQSELMKGLKELNVDLNLTDLLITHMHIDHSGLASFLQKQGVQTIYFSQIDGEISNQAPKWDAYFKKFNHKLGFGEENSLKFGKEFGKRQTEPLSFSPLFEGNKIIIGDFCFEVVEIPGHTPGHIGLYERNHKLFFCGDHVLDEITPNITFWGFEEDILATYFKSLAKIQEYEIDYLFTAHRKIIRDHRKRILELLQHHEERLNEIIGILKAGRKTPVEIAASMRWDLSHKEWADFPYSQKWFAAGEALSHLEHLVHTGIAERMSKVEVLHYALK